MQCCRFSMSGIFFYPLSFIVFVLCLFSSCGIVKPTAYFQTLNRDTSINKFVSKDMESKIVKNDLLSINVSSLNKTEDEFYNGSALQGSATLGAPANPPSNYMVDLEGNIQIHNLGKIHVEGMTRKELKDSLEIDLLPYLKDPIVKVSFLNRRITILGEISKPQVIDMQAEQMPLLEALASSGDVTLNALKKDVLIIRTTPNGKTFKHVNLENASIFKDSSWYNLQSGDIVYVEPNLKKLITQDRNTRLQQALSITSIFLSIIILVLQLSR
jgi:polysaccharide biosynthesis/export protein